MTAQMSVSLDGFYAGPEQEDQSDWLHGTEAAGFFRVTRWATNAMSWRQRLGFEGGEKDTNSELIEEQFASAGAYVMGRRMFDGGEAPWGEDPPFRAPVFVVTHREREVLPRDGGTSFTFVTDGIESAVTQAKAAAAGAGKDVAVAGGGRLVRQVLAAGLLDRLDLHIVPVVLGDGLRLLDPALGLDPMEAIELTPARVVATPDVTHIRYTVEGRAPLVLDDRGSGRPIEAA
ncbi:MAG TPA: dihydrofolate reductase family protein [Acidimicrobiales bacterium]|nr:dihydrofolate reductase family protein [Acidimicrobiales bacterium]